MYLVFLKSIDKMLRQNLIQIELELFTVGGTYWGNYGDLSTIFEGAYQFGSLSGNDLSAYLFIITVIL